MHQAPDPCCPTLDSFKGGVEHEKIINSESSTTAGCWKRTHLGVNSETGPLRFEGSREIRGMKFLWHLRVNHCPLSRLLTLMVQHLWALLKVIIFKTPFTFMRGKKSACQLLCLQLTSWLLCTLLDGCLSNLKEQTKSRKIGRFGASLWLCYTCTAYCRESAVKPLSLPFAPFFPPPSAYLFCFLLQLQLKKKHTHIFFLNRGGNITCDTCRVQCWTGVSELSWTGVSQRMAQ